MLKFDGLLCEHVGLSDSKKILERKPAWVAGNISVFDQPLLMGLTKILQPKKVVEIGVASGWSGCLFIDALSRLGQGGQYIGIDFSEKYYLDASRKTGSAIGDLFPDPPLEVSLLLGSMAVDVVDTIGPGVDLAFIDGNHLHPWAILDLMSLLPILKPTSYVLLHDISLSTFERHRHTNRGPKYLFECWPYSKVNSSQDPTMIGAIQMPPVFGDALWRLLLDTLYTPWETTVDPKVLGAISTRLRTFAGEAWGKKFSEAFLDLNAKAKLEQLAVAEKESDRLIHIHIEKIKKHTEMQLVATQLSEASSYFPKSQELLHELSVSLDRLGRVSESVRVSTRCMSLGKSNPHYLSFHGLLLQKAGDLQGAEEYLRAAVAIDATNSVFLKRLASLKGD